ncbi:hypothetical protein ACF3DV_09740 [Chlorogloeopsis fritschii PCC 9212]|uniref:hypothetical protein n=1 Tax=Chlorogloeopsis fritschii TaxID=1124 RepID=UPI0002EAEC6E|nr:hypothetical protein [Chlorogloeopsis fritschii]
MYKYAQSNTGYHCRDGADFVISKKLLDDPAIVVFAYTKTRDWGLGRGGGDKGRRELRCSFRVSLSLHT